MHMLAARGRGGAVGVRGGAVRCAGVMVGGLSAAHLQRLLEGLALGLGLGIG